MSGHGSQGGGHEQDLNFKAVVWLIPVSMIVLIVYVVTVWFGATSSMTHEMARKQAQGAEPLREPLMSFRAKEDSVLHGYGWADKEKGLVRIPIEKAMDLLLREAATPVAAAKPFKK